MSEERNAAVSLSIATLSVFAVCTGNTSAAIGDTFLFQARLREVTMDTGVDPARPPPRSSGVSSCAKIDLETSFQVRQITSFLTRGV
jgi:hypothetical protein